MVGNRKEGKTKEKGQSVTTADKRGTMPGIAPKEKEKGRKENQEREKKEKEVKAQVKRAQ